MPEFPSISESKLTTKDLLFTVKKISCLSSDETTVELYLSFSKLKNKKLRPVYGQILEKVIRTMFLKTGPSTP
ncbi:MAG: hypothetical protein ACI9S8_000146 [Chlamydiales bacterium]|jgi:hypothetical protein